MRKTLFSVLPLSVFLGPFYLGLPLLPGLAPSTTKEPTAVVVSDGDSPFASLARGLRAHIADARRALEQLPEETTDFVTLAVAEGEGARVHLVRLAKEQFLKKDAEIAAVSLDGTPLVLKILRPNYVNTAVEVRDARGRVLRPLVVRYPIEKGGRLKEVAYYTSAHPAVSDREVERAGRAYVHQMLNRAAASLARKGKKIAPDIVDAAERLCYVEHTDHKRFLGEDQGALLREVQALYGLNSGDTYRFSVSSAGAGGMVQMIPPTYKAMRERHPSVGLKPDFVEGMRDHSNALEAMLLYMQDTWDDLLEKDEVVFALNSGLATQAELLAAGYNSNPVRLPKYLREGGAGWRGLIPEETKMYLRIYAAVEREMDFRDRA
jgi:hypothetical protein